MAKPLIIDYEPMIMPIDVNKKQYLKLNQEQTQQFQLVDERLIQNFLHHEKQKHEVDVLIEHHQKPIKKLFI